MDSFGGSDAKPAKTHRVARSGLKAEKRKKALLKKEGVTGERPKNPKAFLFQSARAARVNLQRNSDLINRRLHVPKVDRTPDILPPSLVVVMGPSGVGKSTLIRSLVKHYTKQTIQDISGPITVVANKNRRLTFFECPNELNAMIDMAKVADLVLIMIDGSYGFEMETFEFLNVLQTHGFPKVIGILSHLDKFSTLTKLKKAKKALRSRFWTEIYPGAKLFYLSGLIRDQYPNAEVQNLARFMSVQKFPELSFRASHSHLIVDRMEDLTHPETKQANPKAPRRVAFFGYLRGFPAKLPLRMHVAGVGDFDAESCEQLADPCPPPAAVAAGSRVDGQRKLTGGSKVLYAPMSDVGAVTFDKDAIYFNMDDHSVRYTAPDSTAAPEGAADETEGDRMIKQLQAIARDGDGEAAGAAGSAGSGRGGAGAEAPRALDAQMESTEMQLIAGGAAFSGAGGGSDGAEEQAQEEDGDEEEETEAASGAGPQGKGKAGGLVFDDDEESDEGYEDLFADSQAEQGDASESLLARYGRQDVNAINPRMLERAIYGGDVGESVDTGSGSGKGERVDSLKLGIRGPTGEADSWQQESAREAIRDRFVTGEWGKREEDAEADDYESLDEEEEEEEDGGEAVDEVEEDEDEDKAEDEEDESASQEEEGGPAVAEENSGEAGPVEDEYARKKALKKAMFDSTYDNTGDDEPAAEAPASKDKDFADLLRARAVEQTQLNREAFKDVDADLMKAYRGISVGSYVRVEMAAVPADLVECFTGKRPLIMGSLRHEECAFGFVQARVKKHRWHRKILKTNDPIIVSCGWRRFQSCPIYWIKDPNDRNRLLKYTPENMHCMMTYYGPLASPTSGLACFTASSRSQASFRVSATGVVTEIDHTSRIVKKLRLTGVPHKILKKTVYVKDMFNSQLEASRFVGGRVQTVSGIRGQIKKAERAPEGVVRATFEDMILPSDIVFLRGWVPVDPRKYCNLVTDLLSAAPYDKDASVQGKGSQWKGMRTTGQVRKDMGLSIPVNSDSLYKTVERKERKFAPLRVSKTLEESLPFSSRPKLVKGLGRAQKAKSKLERGVRILQGGEKRAYTLMQQLNTIRKSRELKDSDKRKRQRQEFLAQKTREEERRRSSSIKKRKMQYVKQGQREQKSRER